MAFRLGDVILALLTAKSSMSWHGFTKALGYLCLTYASDNSDIRSIRTQLVRTFECLGFAEIDFSVAGGCVHVAAPCLVRLPLAGAPRAFFTGARSLHAINELQSTSASFSALQINLTEPRYSQVPTRMVIEAADDRDLSAFATAVGIHYDAQPASWAMLHASADVAAYRASLNFSAVKPSTWPKKVFNHQMLRFQTIPRTAHSLAVLTNPRNQQLLHLYTIDNKEAEVDRDWGRYLVLQDHRRDVLHYDDRACLLTVPAAAPLPRPYARALALCSGYDPYDAPNPQRLLYRFVPEPMATLLAKKLGQKLTVTTIEWQEGGRPS